MSDNNPFFEIVSPRPVTPRTPTTPPIAAGEGWRIERQEDGLWLFYISGEHQGEERAILVTEADADALAQGRRQLDEVLIARAAG